jgi:WD40 repeat protein
MLPIRAMCAVRLVHSAQPPSTASPCTRCSHSPSVDTTTHDTRYVVSGSEDGDVCYWDLVEGRMVYRAKGAHPSVITSASYHPTKPALLTASVDGTVKLWECEPRRTDDMIAADE